MSRGIVSYRKNKTVIK